MSNINNEFELYWANALHAVHDKTTFTNDSIKEFCRQMFIDMVVDVRGKNESLYVKTIV